MSLASHKLIAVLVAAVSAFACAPALAQFGQPPITTIAGTGASGNTGNGGAATSATIGSITGLAAWSPAGAFVFADPAVADVRQVVIGGNITRVGGVGADMPSPDGPTSTTGFTTLTDIAPLNVNQLGGPPVATPTYYTLERQGGRLREVDPNGAVTTRIPSISPAIPPLDNPSALTTFAGFDQSTPTKTVLIGEERDPTKSTDGQFQLYNPNPGAGQPAMTVLNNSGGVMISQIRALAPVPGGEANAARAAYALIRTGFFPNGQGSWEVRGVDAGGVSQAKLAGGGGDGTSEGVDATTVQLADPRDITPAWGTNAFVVADAGTNRIRYVDPNGLVWTLVGGPQGQLGSCPNGTFACGDGQDAFQAQLNQPTSVANTPDGLLIGDQNDHRIRMIPSSELLLEPAANSPSSTAGFTYRSWDPEAQFRCGLDGPAATPCSPQNPSSRVQQFSYSNVADGQHTFRLAYVEPTTGIPDSTPLEYTWTVDTVAPDAPVIDSEPANPTNSTSASFGFTPAEPGGTLECALDAAAYVDCDSSTDQGYASLAEGAHSFSVRQKDAAGNTGTADSSAWTVDTSAPPSVSLGTTPANPTTSHTASFTFTPNEAGGAIKCKLDSGSYATCATRTSESYSSVPDGQHTFRVIQLDDATNSSTETLFTWTIDSTGPVAPTFVTKPPATTNQTSAQFGWSLPESGTNVVCKLDSGTFGPCTTSTTQIYGGPLTDGAHTFTVHQVDALGNVGDDAVHNWTVDSDPPAAPAIDSNPDANTSATSAAFTFTADEPGGSMQCKLDSASFTACASPSSQSYPGPLANGQHTFQVRQVDGANNNGVSASYVWKVDTIAPAAPTLETHPPGASNSTTATFTFTPAEAGGIVQCKLDGAPFGTCATPNSQTYSALSQTSHSFVVRQTDGAGNVSPEVSFPWTVDVTAPAAPAFGTKPNAIAGSNDPAQFTFTTENSAFVECKLNDQDYSECGSPVSYAPPFADGPYSFAVRQTDAAGNVSPVASYSWIVDSGPPAAPSINAHPSDPTNETSASFSFLPSEGGGQLRCSIDTPPAPSSTCDSRTTASYASLADGAHTFYVQQLDVANNLGPAASFTWTIDLTPPATAALQTPADGAGGQPAKPSFTWAPVPGAAKYELLVDGKLIATVASCGSTCSADATDALDERAHKWTVRTYDTAANSAASPERTFSVAVAPIASVLVAPNPVLANRPATFDGSASTDVGTGIVDYKWDLDGDGSFETDTGPNPKATQSYSTARTFTAHLRVTDGVGLTSEASTELRVTSIAPAGKPVGVSINDGAQYTNDPKVTLFAVWPSFATDMLVSNDGGFGAGQLFPVAEQQPWALDSSGPERLPKTVYVRYQAGSPTTQTFTDDIILDQTPPKVVSASVAKPAGATSAAATITLKLKATDNVSGVAGVQVSSNPKKPGAVKKFKAKLKVKKAKKLFVRVQDKAGNFSSWKPVKKH